MVPKDLEKKEIRESVVENIIKDNERTKLTPLLKYLSHFILEKLLVREIDGDTCTQKEYFSPYLLPGSWGCQRLHPLASRIVSDLWDALIGCVSLVRLRFSALSKSDLWLSRGLLPVTRLFDLTVMTRCHPPV